MYILDDLVSLLLWLVFIIGFYIVCMYGIAAQEINQCHRYQMEAASYSSFYITKGEKDTCDSYNINVIAPVI